MAVTPVEWELSAPLDGQPLAIIRLVRLGAKREAYYRSVTANPDRSARVLIGYWGSLDEADRGTRAIYEHGTGQSLSGGNLPVTSQLVPQKPPPVEPIAGYAAPVQNASRQAQPAASAQPGALTHRRSTAPV